MKRGPRAQSCTSLRLKCSTGTRRSRDGLLRCGRSSLRCQSSHSTSAGTCRQRTGGYEKFECSLPTEGVSKLEILRFSGVTSPLPEGYEANTARSDESTFSLAGRGARFDTVWTRCGHTTRPRLTSASEVQPPFLGGRRTVSVHSRLNQWPKAQCRRRACHFS